MVLLLLEGFKCIVATPEMDIIEVDLLEDYGAFVVPNLEHPRPALDLLAEGITVVTFDEGAHGRLPSGSFLKGLVEQAERLAAASGVSDGEDDDDEFNAGFMRGGAEPKRVRIDTKVPDPEAWIVVFHHLAEEGTAVPIGSIIKGSSSLRRLGNFGVDRDGGSGHYFLQLVRKYNIPKVVKHIQSLYDALHDDDKTPRDDDAEDAKKKKMQADIDAVDKGAMKGAAPGGPAPLAPDIRTFPLIVDVIGKQHRDFFTTARSLDEANVTDCPLSGPRSVRWILKFIGDQCNTGPTGRLQQFMGLCKLSFQDKYVSEYAVLCKIFEYAIQYDQLRVSNLACMELVSRRLQLIEEKYRFRMPQLEGNAGATDPENDHSLFMGLGTAATAGRLSIMVMPELSTYIGEELAKEAAISKGKIKAHELREGLRKMNNPKHGNKGKGDDA